ncbi:MAG: ABC transporter permease [Pseudomonadota bacterium]|nr:ABC transporter permease [Pseudomonadota bacterium]
MSPHLGRRLGLYALAAWFALTLNFLLPRLMPGDPAQALFARFQGRLEPAALEALTVTLGLSDAPIAAQYGTYLGQLARGELGISLVYFPSPVSEVIAGGLGWTLFLAGGALVVAFVLGSAIGAVAAWRRGGWLDTIAPPLLSFLGAFPYFWLAMAAAWLLGFQLGWFPVRHAYGPEVNPSFTLAFAASAVRHALLPGATMVLASLGGWVLTMRNAMMGVLDDEPIRFAQARGLPPGRVFFHYGIRNALLPSLTSFGMALGFVLSGALLTEIVFAYPGQGYLLLQAVRGQDYPLLQGLFLTITLAVLAANAIVDVVVVLLDPRARG